MLKKEIAGLLPKFIEWIEINEVGKLDPGRIAEEFSINKNSAKKLMDLATENGDIEVTTKRLDSCWTIKK